MPSLNPGAGKGKHHGKQKDSADRAHQVHRTQADLIRDGIKPSADDEQRNQQVMRNTQEKGSVFGNSGRLKMGPAKKKAVLKHHSEQPFFNIVVGLAPPNHHRWRSLPGQVNQLELTHF